MQQVSRNRGKEQTLILKMMANIVTKEIFQWFYTRLKFYNFQKKKKRYPSLKIHDCQDKSQVNRYMIFFFLQSNISLNYQTIFHGHWYNYALYYTYWKIILVQKHESILITIFYRYCVPVERAFVRRCFSVFLLSTDNKKKKKIIKKKYHRSCRIIETVFLFLRIFV